MLLVVVKKELKRVFTDRRLVFSSFILPALSIYILYYLMGNMIGSMSDDIDDHVVTIGIVNSAQSFNEFVEDYKQSDSVFKFEESYYEVDDTGNIKESALGEKVKAGDIDVLVVFEDDFDAKVINYTEYTHPNIDTYYNSGEEYSSSAYSKVQYQLIDNYQRALLSQRFGGLETLSAFTMNIDNKDNTITEEGKEAGLGMSFMLPMLLNIMLFAGAMGIGIDVIAGEKERGTMATLLMTPVKRETIALGKVLSLGIVAVISATCTFGAILLSLPNASELLAAGSEVSFDSFAFGASDLIILLVTIILQVGIFVGLICTISVVAKSVKEAGTYISPIYMLVMISAFATVFTSGDVELFKFMIPVMGNVFVIKELFTFDLTLLEFGVAAGTSVIVIGILLKLITLAFNNERTMFNN